MAGDREERIRQRAYALWEGDGGAHGRHDDHWAQATREIDADAGPQAKRARRSSNSKPVVAPVASKAAPASEGAKAGTKKPKAETPVAIPADPVRSSDKDATGGGVAAAVAAKPKSNAPRKTAPKAKPKAS